MELKREQRERDLSCIKCPVPGRLIYKLSAHTHRHTDISTVGATYYIERGYTTFDHIRSNEEEECGLQGTTTSRSYIVNQGKKRMMLTLKHMTSYRQHILFDDYKETTSRQSV